MVFNFAVNWCIKLSNKTIKTVKFKKDSFILNKVNAQVLNNEKVNIPHQIMLVNFAENNLVFYFTGAKIWFSLTVFSQQSNISIKDRMLSNDKT